MSNVLVAKKMVGDFGPITVALDRQVYGVWNLKPVF